MEHINETKKSELNVLRRKKRPGLMFQLWGMMMGLVVLTAACMWFVQVFFFEHTYAETALSNSLKQLQPVMSDLTNRDLTEDDRLLPFLSRMIDGTIFLVDDVGDLTGIYSYGHLLAGVQNEPEYGIWKFIRNSDEFSNVKARQIYQNVIKGDHHMISIHIGIPVTYAGENAYLLIENTIRTIKEAQAEKEKTRMARQELTDFRTSLDALASKEQEEKMARKMEKLKEKQERKKNKKNEQKAASSSTTATPKVAPISVGENVKIKGQTSVGQVMEISGKNAIVAFGSIKTTVKLDRLERSNAAPKTESMAKSTFVSSQTHDQMYEKKLSFKQDIDVRGMRGDEALQAVTYFIDDAILVGMDRVRILHGTGTGILRTLIRQYLSTVPGVSHYADEHVQFGGAGITVVDFD